jgi:low affinity Fe/Cu permease
MTSIPMNSLSSTSAARAAHPFSGVKLHERQAHTEAHLTPVSDGMVVLSALIAIAVLTLVAICAGPLAGTAAAWKICVVASVCVVAVAMHAIRHNQRLRASQATLQYLDAVIAQRVPQLRSVQPARI